MGTAGQSITLANSIIGVGILAMPFCFQQCGVLLATLILLFMGLISRLCCYFLLKAALMARRRNFEFLAFYIFGPAGKLAVEVGIIGFLMGTCIAYFVVVGDLGPQIIAKLLNINQSDILRTSIMVVVSVVCVLPLGLLRNVDSLSNVSAATIGFYFCLVIKVIAEAGAVMWSRSWPPQVETWRPAGVLQCVPIFSMALFCQTQLFEIFESLPTVSMDKMNLVTKNAINICTSVYFTLGLFGYIAFGSQAISGNVLMSLSPTMASDVIKLGFVMSLAFSFPLIIFPCRASLYSFLYRKAHPSHHDHIINNSIPETTFRCITVGIIIVSLCVSLVLPNIELVLGLVGATIGVLVCVVFPAAAFLNLTTKNNNDRILAKGVLILGLVILVLGTYANLQAAESQHDRYDNFTPERIDKIVEDFFEKMEKEDPKLKNIPEQQEEPIKIQEKDSVIQPPNPVPPASSEKQAEKIPEDEQKNPKPAHKPVFDSMVSEIHPKNLATKLDDFKLTNGENEDTIPVELEGEKPKPQSTQERTQEKIDTIKKQNLIETIKQNKEEQKELIEEQKVILNELIKTKNELKQKKNDIERVEAKKIAVESIQKIADMAIKKLSEVTEKPGAKADVKNEPLENIANEVAQEIAKKAVKAIEEISEQKSVKKEEQKAAQNFAEDPINNIINDIPELKQASIGLPLKVQPNVLNNAILPSVSNFAPVNPPAHQLPVAKALDQNQNIPVLETNNIPVMSNNVPLPNPPQPVVNQIVKIAGKDNVSPVLNQNMPAQDQKQQSQPNLHQNENKIQTGDIVQQQINLQQNQPEHKKSSVEVETIQKNQVNSQDIQQPTNVQIKNVGKQTAHSHSPDEPQSYKLGEDSQKHETMVNNVAQNVPILIAMNGNAQTRNENKDAIPHPDEVKDTFSNKVEPVQNNDANNVNSVPRQKREVSDEKEIKSLRLQNEEICNKPSENKIYFNTIEKEPIEILPSNVNLAEVGLKQIPMVHVGRSLKSIDKLDKKR